ncbi:MAG: endonuclease III [Actinomycetota bacterium]|nr:endonuclease III [Actinomycetota bacterium]
MAEKKMKRPALIIERLDKLYPGARTALRWSSPWELLVAVVLSAQCTDERVNQVTADLFKKYRSVADFAGAESGQLEQDVRPTGFFRNKTKNIIGAAGMIVAEYAGQVPKTMPELLRLPGVARKSANIILAEAYGVIAGIPVDTHVKRLTNRLGLTKSADPEKIESEMMAIVPRSDWYRFSSVLIYHGRAVCVARKPKCDICVLNDICPSAFRVSLF